MKILILEDNADDVFLVERALKRAGLDCTLTRVDTQFEFTDAIRKDTYDVILSDHSLPQFNSLEALKLCQRANIRVPFILVTGSVSEDFAVQVLKKGADDYVLKSNLTRLHSSIQNAIIKKREEAARMEAESVLRRQNDKLVKINDEMDNFVYSLSHNLSAPLKSLLGLIDICQGESKPRDVVYDQYFVMMEQSIVKLDDTIKEILEYSRNTHNEIKTEKIDIAQLLSDATERSTYLPDFNRLKIQTKIEGDSFFYSDYARLLVVFFNLLSNAVKYLDKSKPSNFLNINFRISDSEIVILFEDNGIGVSEESLPKLFAMFFRGTELSDGAGLGLYITKEIINKLGGNIKIYSSLGNGTAIEISIPNKIKPVDSLMVHNSGVQHE